MLHLTDSAECLLESYQGLKFTRVLATRSPCTWLRQCISEATKHQKKVLQKMQTNSRDNKYCSGILPKKKKKKIIKQLATST